MCGIAIFLAGVGIIRADPSAESIHADAQEAYPVLQMDDIKARLLRRGPDYLDSKKLCLYLNSAGLFEKHSNLCSQYKTKVISDYEEGKQKEKRLFFSENEKDFIVSSRDVSAMKMQCTAELDFLGATLQLRGRSPVSQPMEDICGNVLVYNGEIFGGIDVAEDANDAEALLHALKGCCSCDCLEPGILCSCVGCGEKSIPQILSAIRGPWALSYWQEQSKTIWFGRDAYGRRSLLVHWPTISDPRFILSSVATSTVDRKDFGEDSGVREMEQTSDYWEELPCGIYSIQLRASKTHEKFGKNELVGEERKHAWTDPLVNEVLLWERKFVDPEVERALVQGYTHQAQKVLLALSDSVMRRTQITPSRIFQTTVHQSKELESAPIALLFSGGLDSMILAALSDQWIDPKYTIDLLNVSFDGHLAPDRISAKAGLTELQNIAPNRRWRLVEIDSNLSDLTWETKHLMSLIHPSKTYMDLNIGLALWLAAAGDGWADHLPPGSGRSKYKSTARILLVGSGADEQCAGYGRHRTKYRVGSWVALQEEMRLDMQRMWRRNLGRDDRCISDHGKEARFPFLDEDVIKTLLEIPLWEIAELDEPTGTGDKKILREVARLLGLQGAAILPKRAIQFGSRIARESNLKNFGSNRAANQASAGSVDIHR